MGRYKNRLQYDNRFNIQARLKKTKNGLDIWTDKSGDKTQECVKAVMEHMLGICKIDNLETITFTIDGICELTLTNLNKPNK